MATIVAMIAFSSLAVDLGRVYVARAELQLAADAAARYAVAGLGSGIDTARANAVAAANDNKADGTPVVLITHHDRDVEFGTWDARTRTFTQLHGSHRSDANAVRVIARRTAALGNAVPLLFAQAIGRPSFDVQASAIATGPTTPSNYGVMALDRVEMYSNAQTDSHNSTSASYSPAYIPDRGGIASNGTLRLDGGNVIVRGDARRQNGSPQMSGGAQVTGSTSPIGSAWNLPNASSDGYSYANNDNSGIPGGFRSGNDFLLTSNAHVHIDAGHYFFNNFTMTNGRLDVRGAVTIYVNGDLLIDNDARTLGNRPSNLRFRVLGNGSVTIKGNYGIEADVYAPQSAVLIDSDKHLYGRVIGRSVRIDSNAQVHFDESLVPATGGGMITLVR
jgi:hypothetical protein